MNCRCQNWEGGATQALWSPEDYIMSDSEIMDIELQDLIYTAGFWVLL